MKGTPLAISHLGFFHNFRDNLIQRGYCYLIDALHVIILKLMKHLALMTVLIYILMMILDSCLLFWVTLYNCFFLDAQKT